MSDEIIGTDPKVLYTFEENNILYRLYEHEDKIVLDGHINIGNKETIQCIGLELDNLDVCFIKHKNSEVITQEDLIDDILRSVRKFDKNSFAEWLATVVAIAFNKGSARSLDIMNSAVEQARKIGRI